MYIDPTGHIFGIDDLIIGAIVGAIIGAITAAVTGGNIWMGVATGAIGGALFGAVGFANVGGLAQSIGHATAGGLSGGISSVMSGGDAFQGALIGAFSAGASSWMGSNVPFLQDTDGGNFGDYLGNVTRRALIGGTVGGSVSSATGGDFWDGAAQGARTSAIAYTANDFMHKSGFIENTRQALGGVYKGAKGILKGLNLLFRMQNKHDFWDVTSWMLQGTNYGGASKSGPGEPTSALDVAFRTHDGDINVTGANWWDIQRADIRQAHGKLIKSSIKYGVTHEVIDLMDRWAEYKRE